MKLQGLDHSGEIPCELTDDDEQGGIFSHYSGLDGNKMYFRAILESGRLAAFEWSLDQHLWLPTACTLPKHDSALPQDQLVCFD
jgi:hypothetical protein